jgi:hypothetical protein
MRIRRGLLFWGCFLIPFGALPLLVRAGLLDAATFAEGWRLWPLILVAVGIAIVVGRSRVAALGTAGVAIVLGLAAGGALAGGNFWLGVVTDCGLGRDTDQHATQTGAFQGAASLDLDLRCGSVDLATGGTTGWTFDADYRGEAPIVNGGSDRLRIRVPSDGGDQRHEWKLTVAPALIREINLTSNAAGSTLDLAGAALARVRANVNAGDLRVDAGSATVDDVDLEMNAGHISLTLGSGNVRGSLQINAGAIDLCVPADAGLRFHLNDQLTFVHNLGERGLSRDGETWTRAGSSGATIDLDVEGNAASFTLNPTGGCR